MRADEADEEYYSKRLWLFTLFPGTSVLTAVINFVSTYPGYGIMRLLFGRWDSEAVTPTPTPISTMAPSDTNLTNISNISHYTNASTSWPKLNAHSPEPYFFCHHANTSITTPTNFALYTAYGSASVWAVCSLIAMLCACSSKKTAQSAKIAIFNILYSDVAVGPIAGAAWAFFVGCMSFTHAGKWMGVPFCALFPCAIIATLCWRLSKCGKICVETSETVLPPTVETQTSPQSRRASVSSHEADAVVNNSGVFNRSPPRRLIEVRPALSARDVEANQNHVMISPRGVALEPAPTHRRRETQEYKEDNQYRTTSTP